MQLGAIFGVSPLVQLQFGISGLIVKIVVVAIGLS
jgi:hypothetical protein